LRYSEVDDSYVLHSLSGDERVLKAQCRHVITTDFAVSKTAEADYTVFLTWAVTPKMDFLLLDIVRDKLEAPDSEELLWNMAMALKRLWTVVIEDVAYQKSIIQRMRRGTPVQKGAFRKGIPVTAFRPMSDKTSRAQSISVWFKSGNFYFNSNIASFADYKKELTSFPRGTHDDMVDATTITQALFEYGEPRMSNFDDYDEVEQMLLEEAAIEEIREVNSDLADFLMDDSIDEYGDTTAYFW